MHDIPVTGLGGGAATRRDVLGFALAAIGTASLGASAAVLTLCRGVEIVTIRFAADGALSRREAEAFAHVMVPSAAWDGRVDHALAYRLWRFADAAGWQAPLVVVAGTDGIDGSREDDTSRALHAAGRAVDVRAPKLDVDALRAAARAIASDGGVGLNLRSAVVHIDTGAPRLWSRQLI